MAKEVYYQPHKIKCADDVVRTVRVKSYFDGRNWCFYADTFFSVPAFVKVRGKTVRGYVGNEDGAMFFSATTYHKNHAMIVATEYAK